MAVLLTVLLTAVSCQRDPDTKREEPQLMVSLYIPGSVMTRAETGMVDPLEAELKITSLQIWAFLSESGTLISYKYFSTGLDNSGMPNSSITRFGLPLSDEMFELLSSPSHPKVDVYAVANAASAVSPVPGETTSRLDLDNLVVTEIGGNWPLTRSVPEAGLPMSGVIKGADVTGGYPVLNISTIKLTRAVSKIRFVFCQQGIPATDSTPAEIANDGCQIEKITFESLTDGSDCKISTTERLFTTKSIDLGSNPGYVNLTSSIRESDGAALIPNSSLSLVEDPEALFFRGLGHETETAEQYESRLDAAIDYGSRVGPIYFRETDKTISGRIYYRVADGGDLLSASFSMEAGDIFSRNHTWIVYACFMEETMKLELKVVVLPWEWTGYSLDFTTSSINVIRRFSVYEPNPATFHKVQTSDGFYDVRFWHTVEVDGEPQENKVDGDIIIATPVGATLHMLPVPGTQGSTLLTDAITVTPAEAVIYPNYQSPDNPNGRIEHCIIPIQIKCNTAKGYTDEQLEGNYIDLHFIVETTDGRYIDLGSESIDDYRFVLKKNWNQ